MSIPQRAPFVKAVGSLILGVLCSTSFLITPFASGATKHASLPPICRPAQLRPSMSPTNGTYSPTAGFNATLWFENTGRKCTLVVDNVPVQAVSGPSHVPVGLGSLSGAVAYPPLILTHDARTFASVSIGSISTPSIKKLMRQDGSSCAPKYANGIEVVSNPAVRTDSWPAYYFALTAKVPVCTKDYFNVSAGVIAKSLTGFIVGRLETNGVLSSSPGYHPYPGLVWATAKNGETYGASVPATGYFHFRVPVGIYHLSGSSPMYGGGTYRCLGPYKLRILTNKLSKANVICIEK